ncbi:essential nuclear protein 1 [Nematocida displodere]|uniref:Essential nuclear protein 1 n=1 Tax=Nematocida displodere TaxID=1805483 RepID=A0A177EEJ4_9MICR|nr:essential nuclear protein 1 [Nematocida displodere]
MDIGRRVISELNNGSGYCDILSRNCEELEKLEEDIQRGEVPSVFRLHSKDSALAPKTPEEFLLLLELVDLRKSKFCTLKEITDRVVGYPLNYYPVKLKVAEVFHDLGKKHIATYKRLEQSLFNGMTLIITKNTKAFTEGVIKPWLEAGMSSTASLVLSRVIMKGGSERVYMEEFIMDMVGCTRSPCVSTLLTSVLIKKIKLSEITLNAVFRYIVDGDKSNGRYLIWNKMVLVFVRGYKKAIDMSAIKELYVESTAKIEREIVRELQEQ